MDVTALSIDEAPALLATKPVSSVELTRAFLDRIRATDRKVDYY